MKFEMDHKPVEPKWTVDYVEDVCNSRAHVLNASTIAITWDTHGKARGRR